MAGKASPKFRIQTSPTSPAGATPIALNLLAMKALCLPDVQSCCHRSGLTLPLRGLPRFSKLPPRASRPLFPGSFWKDEPA